MVSKDNVLITITTAANMGGIEQAKAGLLGLNVATLGLTVAVAGAVMAGKSMIEISEKQDAAHRSLEQAVSANNASLGKHAPIVADVTKQTDALEKAERRLAEVEAGMPPKHKATRLELMHLQDAHQAVTDAQEKLTAAQEAGQPVMETSYIDIKKLQTQIDTFIQSNRSYISSQSEVEDSYGALIRSGVPVAEVQKDMNRAVDLAALKGISLSEATGLLVKAEQGRLRGLIDLGISTGKYTDAEGNLINGTKDVGRAMAEFDAKTAGARNTLTQTQQISNRISMDWQDLASKGGPPLLDMLDKILNGADAAYTALAKIGSDPHSFDGLNDALVAASQFIHDYLILPLSEAWNWLAGVAPWGNYKIDNVGGTNGMTYGDLAAIAHGQAQSSSFGKGGRASGGPVMPGRSYDVGETAMETLTMFPGGGGYVTPSAGGRSGGGQVHVHLDGIYAGDGPSLDILANKIALRLGYATGR